MKNNSKLSLLFLIGFLLIWAGISAKNLQAQEKQAVYEFLLEGSSISFEEAEQRLSVAIDSSAFRRVAVVDQAAPAGCSFRTRMFVVEHPQITQELFRLNGDTAPFAALLRINLFEDERGVNLSIVNPRSVFRTILLDDPNASTVANQAHQALTDLIKRAFPETEKARPYGQVRKKGYIGRTMGVMAGGPFDEKVKTIATLPETTIERAVRNLVEGFERNTGEWQLRARLSVVLVPDKIAVIGVSSPEMERKSFDIVKAGSDGQRKDLSCPGIAHAGAYPIELVLRQADQGVEVQIVEVMYRMKMYFEDAGKWAFAKNMGMPGSIQSEIEAVVKTAVSVH